MERVIVLLSHGEFAKGLKQMAEMVLGELPRCHILSFEDGMGIEQFTHTVKNYLASAKNKKILALCDLKNGTPFNVIAARLDAQKSLRVFYGMNFPMLAAAVEWLEGSVSDEDLKAYISDLCLEQIGEFSLGSTRPIEDNF